MKAKSKYFGLDIKLGQQKVLIRMELLVPIVRTNQIPQTFYILEKQLPKVLITKCFNERKFPFRKEVKDTEIGHLFEHILLQNILDAKLALGEEKFAVDGVTEWNWKRDKRGVFNIQIGIGLKESEIFNSALYRTNQLINRILASGLKN